jgi:threonylcarbamoyladenosine tRNA methylthiotransferase MtaB
MSIEVVTFGCRLNSYESEVMRENAQKAGLSDTIIFNTCAVTAEAERQARQAIRRARREHPQAKIIVTGCSAQIKPEVYAEMEEVNHVLGNQEKMSTASYLDFSADSEKIRVNDIMSVKETASHMVTSFDGRARAFVQVQNGCNHRCTFCIIPYGRGNSRSVPIGEIVKETRALVENGYKEIVLTGVDISDYGKDLPGQPTLGQMMRRLLALVPELPRLRLSSIDAVEVDEDIYRLIAEEPRLMPHIHISLQAGDDMILKRMKRRHSRKDALDFCAHVRSLRPDVVFGADIIAGFPTETEDMFVNTLNMVEEAGLTYLHVFPYSARSGTPAARMPQVVKEIRKERAARLRERGEQQMQKFFTSWVGKETSAIVENGFTARTDHFAPVTIDESLISGELVKIRVTGADAGTSAIVENGFTARTDHFAPVTIDESLISGELVKIRVTGADAGAMTGKMLH